MAGSILKLPSGFDEDKIYSLKGKTLIDMMAALQADRVVPGTGQTESQTAKGRVISGGVGEVGCALGEFSSGKVSPGYIIGGGKSEMITPGVMTPVAGNSVWVSCAWTANEIDGVLVGGGTMGTVSAATTGATVPADDEPEFGSLTGTAYVVFGGWDSDLNWISSGCGAVYLDFCPGGFIKSRGEA